MSEISIKIKGPISRVVKTKKKAKARTGKPKTKTDAYLEKLKGREFSYNTSPFYDYKAGLQPTYIYRQQTIPQLQQDNKHTELIKYLEDMKKSDRESQTGKFRNTGPPPIPYFPDPYRVDEPNEDEQKTASNTTYAYEDVTKQEELEGELEEEKKGNEAFKKLRKLEKELTNTRISLSKDRSSLKKALDREKEGNKGGYPSSVYQERINDLELLKKVLETQIAYLNKTL